MGALAGASSWIGPALSIGGTLLGASGQRSQAKAASQQADQQAEAAKKAAEYSAVQHEYIAGQTRATSQREAAIQRHGAKLLASRALAVAAASGAGATDPTVTNIIGDIIGEGAYRAALAMYEGEEEAKQHEFNAETARATGIYTAAARNAESASISRASNLSMFGTLLSGGASFADKYGGMFNSGGGLVDSTAIPMQPGGGY